MFFACKKDTTKNTEDNSEPVVKVFGQYLYASDLASVIPPNSNSNDSASIIQSYMNNWIQDQLMLHQAEEFLVKQKSEIDKKTEEFRKSLIIHKFKEEIVTMNIDSNITNDQILNYYEAHKSEFKISSPIVRGYFVKIPKSSNSFAKFKILLNESDEPNLDEIISFVNINEGSFDDFTTKWVIFSKKMLKIPIAVEDENNFLKRSSTFETEDDDFYYYMHINDFYLKNDFAPIDYVKNNIVNILIQIKSTTIIDKYKQDIYDKAINSGDIEYFN